MRVDELENRLKKEFPNVYKTILINGDWGIGKTYFLKNRFLKDKDNIYISLFGINNIESFKIEIYSRFNKILGGIKKLLKKTNGISIGIKSISLPISYWETDICNIINKKTKNKTLTIVVDDLERKSRDINIEDLLGTIETIAKIKNVNVILVANENKMDKEDKDKFLNFKEKVIQKTYNLHKYSKNTPNELIKYLLKDVKTLKNISIEDIKRTIVGVLSSHPVNNLRTLEKGINFVKLVMEYVKLNELHKNEINDIIKASLCIIIEKNEKLYTKNKEQKNEEIVKIIVKNYFVEQSLGVNKSTIINLLLDIYQDLDIQENFKELNKFYKDLHTINDNEKEIDMFYMSEEQLIEKINNFYNNYILKVDKSLNANNWLKRLNEVYAYAELIGRQNIFKDKEILKAIDEYINDGLYTLDRNIIHISVNKRVSEYEKELIKKMIEKYYLKCIEDIILKIENGNVGKKDLDKIYAVFTDTNTSFNKEMIIKKIEENKFFIPDLNYQITENQWFLANEIWECALYYKECIKQNPEKCAFRYNEFKQCVSNLLKGATIVGKHRIEYLNRCHAISLDTE